MPLLRAAALSDIGRVRRENEERFLLDEKALLFGVADGVGGLSTLDFSHGVLTDQCFISKIS
jgi:protein phosphatase